MKFWKRRGEKKGLKHFCPFLETYLCWISQFLIYSLQCFTGFQYANYLFYYYKKFVKCWDILIFQFLNSYVIWLCLSFLDQSLSDFFSHPTPSMLCFLLGSSNTPTRCYFREFASPWRCFKNDDDAPFASSSE